ncbi:dihydrodipicolinate synthase family protein [Nonomuraea sp. NPDC059194]|uniref:dihydrodipicolinate synthase family protein n=1 Tax=Nonomuraea sp. NPDC059194 TaxID=3346764 RepID=UPI0036AA9E6C
MSTVIDPRAARLRDRLRGALVAAAATPMTRSGEVDPDLAERYYRRLVATGADALAVLAHTGRGPYLPPEVRRELIVRARRAGVPVVVGVGGSPAAPSGTAPHPRAAQAPGPTPREGTGIGPDLAPDSATGQEPGPTPGEGANRKSGAVSHSGVGRGSDPGLWESAGGAGPREGMDRATPPAAGEGAVERTVADARMAAELGADGILVFPSPGDRLAENDAVWQATGLPMIAFDLYTAPCPPAVLTEILRHPGVAGLKTALLSDAMGCQATIAMTRQAGRLAITGEDRMFGPSLLWGAEAALVGIAAASVEATAAVMRAFEGDDLRAFDKASARLDRLATATFTAPMEGYVQRMLWLAAAEGLIPESHAHDPFGPDLPETERAAVLAASA